MANWDLIGAVADAGAGLMNTLGQRKQDQLKGELKRKLELEDEARKDAKEALIPKRTEFIENENGRQVIRSFNANDELIGERAASKTEIEEINHTKMQRDRAGQKEDLSIEKLLGEVAFQPEEQAMKREAHTRGLEQRDYSNQTSRISAEKPSAGRRGGGIEESVTGPKSPDSVAYSFMESPMGKNLQTQYVGEGPDKLTYDEYVTIVRGATNNAYTDKKDAVSLIRLALQGAIENKGITGTTRSKLPEGK